MNTANIALVRTVIKELMESGRVNEGTPCHVHHLYKQPDPDLEGDFLDMGEWFTRHECGTAACLAGWLAQDPRVQEAGLRLEGEAQLDNSVRLVPVYGEGAGRSKYMWALRRFLGFKDLRNASHIFGSDHPNTFASALERLDEAVAREKELQNA